MVPTPNAAIVEDTIRGFPRRETIRGRATNWALEDFEYALTRIDQDTHVDCQEKVARWIEELIDERKQQARDAATLAQMGEIRARIEELRKPHWTVLPNFWLTIISAAAAVFAAVFAWMALK